MLAFPAYCCTLLWGRVGCVEVCNNRLPDSFIPLIYEAEKKIPVIVYGVLELGCPGVYLRKHYNCRRAGVLLALYLFPDYISGGIYRFCFLSLGYYNHLSFLFLNILEKFISPLFYLVCFILPGLYPHRILRKPLCKFTIGIFVLL